MGCHKKIVDVYTLRRRGGEKGSCMHLSCPENKLTTQTVLSISAFTFAGRLSSQLIFC